MPPHSSSSLHKVLQDAEQDLDRCEWPGLMGFVLHPIRDNLWLPSMKLAQAIIVPTSSTVLPKVVDTAASATVGAACGAVKFAYGVLPHTPSMREISVNGIHQECMQSLDRLPERFGARDVIALVLSGIGLVSNVIIDVFTNPGQKFGAFVDTIKVFIAFLIYVGIDEELAEAFLTPRIVTNMAITARIQAALDSTCTQNRRKQAAFVNDPIDAATAWTIMKESERFMKFSTAAYGTFQIYASGTLQAVSNVQALAPVNDAILKMQRILGNIVQKLRRRRIAKYLDIAQSQILYLTPPGGDVAVVRHFVAVDHDTMSVILAIRGTYSASDVIADIDGATTDFCEGVAHKGMAERAINLLRNESTMNAITRGLEDHPAYRLIFTGHSLGAGIAALMAIRIHYVNHPFAQEGRLQCFGFACPPVYGQPLSSPPSMHKLMGFQRVKRAIANTVCFINGEDVVPFLSIDSIRRLSDMLDKVDAVTEHLNPIDRFLIARGLKEVPKELVSIVQDGSLELNPIPGAERLKIPALVVMWMDDATARDDDDESAITTDVVLCRPSKLSNLSILLADEFILDHLPPRYEERFEDLFGRNSR